MAVVVGKIIKAELERRGLSKTEFARRINTSNQNVHGIFKRTHFDTELLTKIGEVLEHDFFQYYMKEGSKSLTEFREDAAHYKTLPRKTTIMVQLELDSDDLLKLGLKDKVLQALNIL